MFISILLLSFAQGKHVSTVISLSPEEPWKYISKFASNIGTSSWDMKVKYYKPFEKKINEKSTTTQYTEFLSSVYTDSKWPDALTQQSCENKLSISKKHKTLQVPTNGKWSEPIEGTLTTNSHTHFWYISLSSCNITQMSRFRVEMNFLQPDGSHFSAEEQGLDYVYISVLIIFFIALCGNMTRLIKDFRKTDYLETNLLVLNIAIGFQFSGIVSEVLHVWVYSYNGRGLVVLDVFSQIFECLSSIIITILLIVISTGWTLKYKNLPDTDIYVPICLFVVVVNLLIVGIGRITEDSYYRNSDFEGLTGYFLVGIRVLMWFWFVFNMKGLYEKADEKFFKVLNRFGIMASGYFLALPVVLGISWSYEACVRNIFVVIAVNCIQILVFVFLTHLFSEKSAFYKASTMSGSVLPGKIQ